MMFCYNILRLACTRTLSIHEYQFDVGTGHICTSGSVTRPDRAPRVTSREIGQQLLDASAPSEYRDCINNNCVMSRIIYGQSDMAVGHAIGLQSCCVWLLLLWSGCGAIQHILYTGIHPYEEL